MLHSQDRKEQIVDMRKQQLILKAQKEERKKKAEENHAEELEINRMKIEMEREQHKATLDVQIDRIPSNTPGAEPPRDARDSGSARSHSMHLETSSSDRP